MANGGIASRTGRVLPWFQMRSRQIIKSTLQMLGRKMFLPSCTFRFSIRNERTSTIRSTMPQVTTKLRFNGHSMVGALERLMVWSPRTARWKQTERAAQWRALGFQHEIHFEEAQAQHEVLCRELEAVGSEVVKMSGAEDLTLDAVYTHDASLASDYGLILMRPGKQNRLPEAARHGSFCES